jgi:AraC-like DNA-binding protein
MLNPAGTAQRIRVTRYAPSPRLAPFVDNFWIIEWDLAGRQPEIQRVLPAPNANLIIGGGRTGLFGVARDIQGHSLNGSGRVIGIRFRPGGLRPFLDAPVSALTDQRVPAKILTAIEDDATETLVLKVSNHVAMIQSVGSLLSPRLPRPDPVVDLVCSIVSRARQENGPQQVEVLASEAGISLRTMQRLFQEYVGVAPKWVIRRYRLQEAAWRIAHGSHQSLSDLAAALGYFDQAHLAREFTRMFGCSPSEYQRSLFS